MKKIMFNEKYGLTKAVFDEFKTNTRRIETDNEPSFTTYTKEKGLKPFIEDNRICIIDDGYLVFNKPTRYKVGEIVAVAQPYKDVDLFYKEALSSKGAIKGQMISGLGYDNVSYKEIRNWFQIRERYRGLKSWANKMYVKPELMPRFIRMNGLRIELLQDISDEDCMKEGIQEGEFMNTWDRYYFDIWGDCALHKTFKTPRAAYASLIDKVSGKGTWDRNPYVVAYDFELIK